MHHYFFVRSSFPIVTKFNNYVNEIHFLRIPSLIICTISMIFYDYYKYSNCGSMTDAKTVNKETKQKFTCSKSTIETLGKGEKYVQS